MTEPEAPFGRKIHGGAIPKRQASRPTIPRRRSGASVKRRFRTASAAHKVAAPTATSPQLIQAGGGEERGDGRLSTAGLNQPHDCMADDGKLAGLQFPGLSGNETAVRREQFAGTRKTGQVQCATGKVRTNYDKRPSDV